MVSDSQPRTNDGVEDNSSAPFAYTEIFEKAFPYYLSIGMTYDQFFNEDCYLAKYYREADKLKQDRLNQQLWLEGLYVYQAIYRLTPILRSLSKATKPEPYLEEPFPRTEKEIREREERKAKEKQQQFMAYMQNLAEAKNAEKKAAEKVDDVNGCGN